MNRLDTFLAELKSSISNLEIEVQRHPGNEDTAAWIDIARDGRSVTIEYLPERGFGLYMDSDDEDEDDGFDSGPTEVYRSHQPLINRLRKFFDGSGHLSITRLREIREVLGVSQKQLSTIFNQEQSSISKMENREKILMHTLISYIHNLGGTIEMKIHFKDCDLPLSVEKFFDIESNTNSQNNGRVTSSHSDG